MSNNTKLLCLFLRAQKINKSSEQGYAMAMVSMVSIIMLSLLAASMTFSNLAKSRTDAFVDSSSDFSVAEAGLNQRADQLSKKIRSYKLPTGLSPGQATKTSPVTPANIANCFTAPITTATSVVSSDFECRNYAFRQNNNIAAVVASNGGTTVAEQDNNLNSSNYIAHTFVADRTNYLDPANPSLGTQLAKIGSGDYAGLNALEYVYTIYSTAKKPNSGTDIAPNFTQAEIDAKYRSPKIAGDDALTASYDTKAAAAAVTNRGLGANNSTVNTVLQMDFNIRVIPLFQFAIFYNGDLEFNSTTKMTVDGWVHSNANIYVQPAGETTALSSESVTTFKSKVSAHGDIYNRVDAWTPGIDRTGITKLLLTGNNCDVTTNCEQILDYDAATKTPLGGTEISKFNGKLAAGIPELTTPSTGFPRKRNYATNAIGESYAKADMRLDFMPDRDVTDKTTTPWTRDTKKIPFNFTAVTTTGTGTCSSTAPSAGTDPAANYIDPKREGLSTLKCNKLTKGQLQSLRQPVMVLTKLNNDALATRENQTLKAPDFAATPLPLDLTKPALTDLSTPELTNTRNNKILRALQVALVSAPNPISLDQLSKRLDTDPLLSPVKDEFNRLLNDPDLFPVNSASADPIVIARNMVNEGEKQKLLTASPNRIAALRQAWFLPAPIQRVETGTVMDAANSRTATTANPTPNPTRSGFYDGREQRWISVLQTNIASLAVWNRDGLYVEASDNTTDLLRRDVYATTDALKNTAFNSGAGANFTDGLAFNRSPADSTKPVGSLQYLGLGSIDSTEGGLIIHASVNDDLDGNGTINATNDITKDTDSPIYKKNADNTDYQDLSLPAATADKRVLLDYLRKYPDVTPTKQSPFAFAFTGGDYLPNNLMLTSDQAIYVQGDFNNNSNEKADGTQPAISPTGPNSSSDIRLSASIVADTITVLSNDCVSLIPPIANPGIPTGQLNCGTKGGSNSVTKPMVINAAFLSNTDVSNGNLGDGRGYNASSTANNKYSGGVNNYIRLLEDWNNGGTPYALNYTGSMVSLGAPLEYSGLYRPGGDVASGSGSTAIIASYYNVPFRNFGYDENFNLVDKMPPLTPKARYFQQKNFSRTY
jgi:Tfp pilus assembly protein PilX